MLVLTYSLAKYIISQAEREDVERRNIETKRVFDITHREQSDTAILQQKIAQDIEANRTRTDANVCTTRSKTV